MSVIPHRRALLLVSALQIPGRSPTVYRLPTVSAVERDTRARTMYYDSHLHVWAKQEDAESGLFPYAGALAGGTGKEPPMPGHAEVLLEAMEEASVSGALIIQPGNHKFDHSYVTSVLKAHPGKFAGMLLANPTEKAGLDQLTQLVQEDGYQGVRFNPYLWPEGESMTNDLGRALYLRAGSLGVPVGHMTFKGLLNHIDDITTLCEDHPDTKVIIDHFGFCSAAKPDGEDWAALYGLARFPQVYVKTSAFFRVSAEDYPYNDTRGPIRELINKFGPDRLMWGSDFPWVTEKCGYVKAWNIISEDDDFLSPTEREWIMGKTFLSLFPSFKTA